jgi:hypothetical protein
MNLFLSMEVFAEQQIEGGNSIFGDLVGMRGGFKTGK